MFSNPADLPYHASTPGLLRCISRPQTWSLRMRLLVTLATLLIFVCGGIGTGTTLAIHRFLMQQLDSQVFDAGSRSVTFYDLGPPPFMRFNGPGPWFLDTPGQSVGTVGAIIAGEHVAEAALITASGDRRQLSPAAYSELGQMPIGRPVSAHLDGVGTYRLIATRTADGDTLVAGLPLTGVNDTLLSVLGIFSVVAAVALTMAAIAGILVIRRQLAPLSRVASAAEQVAGLELGHGEVQLPTRVVTVKPAAAHTEVGRLSTAFNQMLDRIADALAMRHASETRVRQFVADASHELRTPLSSIRGYNEVARQLLGEMPEDLEYAMGRVDSEARRMTRLVEDMLLLARLDAGRPFECEAVDMSQLVIDTVSDAHIAGPDHRWGLDLPDEPVIVDGDRARLHQVLANLLSNARVHTPPGTKVTTGLACADGAVVLTVADNGPGIPEDQLPEIFERFARGDSSRSRRAGSTGLGLAIVAAVVKAHEGAIAVFSTPGSTTFTVNLPGPPPTPSELVAITNGPTVGCRPRTHS